MFVLSLKAGLRAKEVAGVSWGMLTDAEGEIGRVIALENRAAKGKSVGRVTVQEGDGLDGANEVTAGWRGKAVLHPVTCDQVRGARRRGQGSETVAKPLPTAAMEFTQQIPGKCGGFAPISRGYKMRANTRLGWLSDQDSNLNRRNCNAPRIAPVGRSLAAITPRQNQSLRVAERSGFEPQPSELQRELRSAPAPAKRARQRFNQLLRSCCPRERLIGQVESRRGTGGSNPAPSSAESVTNSVLALQPGIPSICAKLKSARAALVMARKSGSWLCSRFSSRQAKSVGAVVIGVKNAR
jgi:hypothetical protein